MAKSRYKFIFFILSQEKIVSALKGKNTIRSMSKKKVLMTQISLLLVVLLFLADRSMVFNWVRNFINMTHSAELEHIFTQLLVPSKTIYELSQAISFFYLLKMLLVVSAVVMLLLFIFVEIVRFTGDVKKAQTVKVSEVAENSQFTYKKQEKFLC